MSHLFLEIFKFNFIRKSEGLLSIGLNRNRRPVSIVVVLGFPLHSLSAKETLDSFQWRPSSA